MKRTIRYRRPVVANDELSPTDVTRAERLRSMMLRVIRQFREAQSVEFGYRDLGGES